MLPQQEAPAPEVSMAVSGPGDEKTIEVDKIHLEFLNILNVNRLKWLTCISVHKWWVKCL